MVKPFLLLLDSLLTILQQYHADIMCRYGPMNPVKHIKVQRNSEGMYFLVDCKMFRTIPVSYRHTHAPPLSVSLELRFSTPNRTCPVYQTPPLFPYLDANYVTRSTANTICLLQENCGRHVALVVDNHRLVFYLDVLHQVCFQWICK